MKTNTLIFPVLFLSFGLATVTHADASAAADIKLRAEAEAIRADGRLKDAQASLINEQERMQALLRSATQEEVGLFHQKVLFAKSLLIEARRLQSESEERRLRLTALDQGLSRLNEGKLAGAQASLTIFQNLGIRPADAHAYREARDYLLGQIPGTAFRCFSRPCIEPAELFPGGTVASFIEFLNVHRYDLVPSETTGVEALQRIGDYVDQIGQSVDAKRLEISSMLNSRVDALVEQTKGLSEFKSSVPKPRE